MASKDNNTGININLTDAAAAEEQNSFAGDFDVDIVECELKKSKKDDYMIVTTVSHPDWGKMTKNIYSMVTGAGAGMGNCTVKRLLTACDVEALTKPDGSNYEEGDAITTLIGKKIKVRVSREEKKVNGIPEVSFNITAIAGV